MYEVQILNRGPEGIRGHRKFRLSAEGGDELHDRMEKNPQASMQELLAGIELAKDKAEDPAAIGGETRTDQTPLAGSLQRAHDGAAAAKPAKAKGDKPGNE